MQERFPEAKPRDLTRFLLGHGRKADKAIPAYEAHLQWHVVCVAVVVLAVGIEFVCRSR